MRSARSARPRAAGRPRRRSCVRSGTRRTAGTLDPPRYASAAGGLRYAVFPADLAASEAVFGGARRFCFRPPARLPCPARHSRPAIRKLGVRRHGAQGAPAHAPGLTTVGDSVTSYVDPPSFQTYLPPSLPSYLPSLLPSLHPSLPFS